MRICLPPYWNRTDRIRRREVGDLLAERQAHQASAGELSENFGADRWLCVERMVMQFLFVGGPHDGQRIDVAADINTVYTEVPTPDGFGEVAYKKEYLRDVSGDIHELYFCDDGRGLIQTLLDAYKAAQRLRPPAAALDLI